MKIVAITRYKNGSLYSALSVLGWSQNELAKRTGIAPTWIGKIINLQKRPTESQANAIQVALAEAGQYVDVLSEWPETFVGLKPGFKREQIEDIEMENLLDCEEAFRIPCDEYFDPPTFGELTSCLTDKEKAIISSRFIDQQTLQKAGKKINLTGTRAQQIENCALHKMRENIRRKKAMDSIGLEQ